MKVPEYSLEVFQVQGDKKLPAAEEPGEAGVGDVGPGQYEGLQARTVNADDAGHVVIALLGQSQDAELVEMFESVGQ